jgi:hypothetical protein
LAMHGCTSSSTTLLYSSKEKRASWARIEVRERERDEPVLQMPSGRSQGRGTIRCSRGLMRGALRVELQQWKMNSWMLLAGRRSARRRWGWAAKHGRRQHDLEEKLNGIAENPPRMADRFIPYSARSYPPPPDLALLHQILPSSAGSSIWSCVVAAAPEIERRQPSPGI